jgi:hypothetical protein
MPGSEIGAGHSTPAKAIVEALARHPEVRAGKVVVQPVIPQNGTVAPGIAYPLHRRDLTVSTGFSGLPEDAYQLPHLRSIYDERILAAAVTGRFVQFLPDTQPRVTPSMMPGLMKRALLDPELGWRASKRYLDPATIRFGEGANLLPPFASYRDISPALTDEALRSIGSVLEGKLAPVVVYQAFAEHLKRIGDQKAASYIIRGIQAADQNGDPYRPILVTGSSRGDYVALKALDTLQALREVGLTGYSVIPLLGKNRATTGQLLKGSGLPLIGGAPQSLHAQLRGTALLNIGSSGASDLNELKALPAPSLIPRHQRQLRDRELWQLTDLSVDERARIQHVDTELWNKGGMQDIERVAQQASRSTIHHETSLRRCKAACS